jgi:hypothetical protein
VSPEGPLARYLRAVPTDEEAAREAVRRFASLDADARVEALVALLRGMDALLAGRPPLRSPDDEAFWRHWLDPSLGRPR